MAVDYATLKKGGFMRQKQKNHFYHSDCRRFDGMVDFRGKSLYTQTITAAFGL